MQIENSFFLSSSPPLYSFLSLFLYYLFIHSWFCFISLFMFLSVYVFVLDSTAKHYFRHPALWTNSGIVNEVRRYDNPHVYPTHALTVLLLCRCSLWRCSHTSRAVPETWRPSVVCRGQIHVCLDKPGAPGTAAVSSTDFFFLNTGGGGCIQLWFDKFFCLLVWPFRWKRTRCLSTWWLYYICPVIFGCFFPSYIRYLMIQLWFEFILLYACLTISVEIYSQFVSLMVILSLCWHFGCFMFSHNYVYIFFLNVFYWPPLKIRLLCIIIIFLSTPSQTNGRRLQQAYTSS